MGIEQLIATQASRNAGPSPIEQLGGMAALEGQRIQNQGMQQRNTMTQDAFAQDQQTRGLEFGANIGHQIKNTQDPAKKAEIYQAGLWLAKKSGIDVSQMPQQYDDQAQTILDVMYEQRYAPQMFQARLKNSGISLSQKEFDRHLEILRPAMDAGGQLKPNLTVEQQAAAVELGLRPRATGSAAITAATTPGLTDQVASSQQTIKTSEKYGTDSGKNAAGYENLANAWEVNREFLMDSIPELQQAFSDAPGSSVSKGVQAALSKLVGNTQGADAQAILEQYGAIFLQGMPFPPGAQSDKEMQARAQTLSDQLTNPSVSPEAKIRLIGTFVEWQDKKAKNYRAKAGSIIGGEAPPAAPRAPSSAPPAPQVEAPAPAIEHLRKNPQLAPQFKEKFGYLPEGF